MRRHVASGPRNTAAADPLEIFAILCLVAWLLGVASGYTGGGSIHFLLGVAAVAVVVRLIQSRRGE